MVTELTGGHDSECADSGQRSSLRAAECVFAITVANGFSFQSVRKIDVTHERIARIIAVSVFSLARLTIALNVLP